jgi:hypothetical protein
VTAREPGIPGWAPATKRGIDVQNHVLRQFGDESGVQLVTTDIIAWINEAQNEIVTRNRVLKMRAIQTVPAGTQQISWPSDGAIQIEGLHLAGNTLDYISMAQAEALNMNAGTETGTPTQFWDWGGYLYLYPIPDVDYSVTLYYSTYPTPIVDISDLLSVPDKYFQAVIAYVMQQAYELDEDWQAANTKAGHFQQAVSGLADEERAGAEMTYPTITLLPEW